MAASLPFGRLKLAVALLGFERCPKDSPGIRERQRERERERERESQGGCVQRVFEGPFCVQMPCASRLQSLIQDFSDNRHFL